MRQVHKIVIGLTELVDMDRAALAVRWQAIMKRPPPKAASRIFLLRALSYELQRKSVLGLTKTEIKSLNANRCDDVTCDAKPKRKPPARVALVPGTRLVREWNGHPYTVSIVEEGFVYKDRVWNSLSAIAKDITGAHWSGPRFFGLDKTA